MLLCSLLLLCWPNQVLSILDGTATHWPGVSAAQEDLEQLVKLAGQQLASLEGQVQQLNNAKTRLQEQNVQLTSRLKGARLRKQASVELAWWLEKRTQGLCRTWTRHKGCSERC
jgi:hypothetical protein